MRPVGGGDGDSEQAHGLGPHLGYRGEAEDRNNSIRSMTMTHSSTVDSNYMTGFSAECHSLQQPNDFNSIELELQEQQLRDHHHLARFTQQYQPSPVPSTSHNSGLSTYSLSDPVAAPYKQRDSHYNMRAMEEEEKDKDEDEDALPMDPASSASFVHQTDQMLQSLHRGNDLLPTVSDHAHLQIQIPQEQNLYHHPLSIIENYGGAGFYTNSYSSSFSNNLLVDMRSNTIYGYGGFGGSCAKNQLYVGDSNNDHTLPYVLDQELKHAGDGATMDSVQQQGAMSANPVQSKTFENIGKSTALYAPENTNAITVMSTGFAAGTGSMKAIGARGERSFEEVCTPRPRWCPTQEQIQILESLFMSGTTTPSRDAIVDIACELRKYGSIAEANVFYWFQNRKARAKRKLQPPPPPHMIHAMPALLPANTPLLHPHTEQHVRSAQPSSSSSSADHHQHGTRHRCDAHPVAEQAQKKKKTKKKARKKKKQPQPQQQQQPPHKCRKAHYAHKPNLNNTISATRSAATSNTTTSGYGGGASSSEQSPSYNANSAVVTPYTSLPPPQPVLCSSATAVQTPSSINSSAHHAMLLEDAVSDPHSYNNSVRNQDLQASVDSAATTPTILPSEISCAAAGLISSTLPDNSSSSSSIFLRWQAQEYDTNHDQQLQTHHHNNDDIMASSSSLAAADRHSYNLSYDESMSPFFRRTDAAAVTNSPLLLPNSYGVSAQQMVVSSSADQSRISLSLAPPAQQQAAPPLLRVNSASDHSAASVGHQAQALAFAAGGYGEHRPDHQFQQATVSRGLSLVSGCAAQQRICEEEEEEEEEEKAMRDSTISSSTDLIPPEVAAGAAADNFSTSINPMILRPHHQNAAFFPRSGSSFSVVQTVRPLISLSSSASHHLHHLPVQVSCSENLARSSESLGMPKLSSSSPLAADHQDHLQLWEEMEPCASLRNWHATSDLPYHSQQH